MPLFDDIERAVAFIRSRAGARPTPKVGVVLGSGLGAFATRLENAVRISYDTIPGFHKSTVEGHAGELVLGDLEGQPLAVMSGRVHYYEGHDMERVTFGVRVLKGLGVANLLVTNAAGSINPDYAPGDFMVITDHINLTGDNPLRGPNDNRLGARFPDMSHAYSPKGRELLAAVAKKLGTPLRHGVYVGLAGPSYETPAEIRFLRTIGGDAVGMSTVGEVIVASHAGLRTVGLSVITNRAAGLSATPLTHDEVKEVGAKVQTVLCDLLAKAAVALGTDTP